MRDVGNQVMFSERTGDGIFFVGDANSGKCMKSDVVDGDSVTLRLEDEQVLVRIISTARPGHYKGIIHGFMPSYGLTFGELEIGQIIEFSDIHIFGCS